MQLAKNFAISGLGLGIILSTTGAIKFKPAKLNLNAALTIHVPGAVLESNIEKLMAFHSHPSEQTSFGEYFLSADSESTNIPKTSSVEGFNDSPDALPLDLKPMWNSTVMLLAVTDVSSNVGSAIVKNIEFTENGANVYLVTNNHVVAESCNSEGICPNLFILNGVGIDSDTGGVVSTGDNLLRAKGAILLKSSTIPDLALLEISVDSSAKNFLHAAHFQNVNPDKGQEVFAIGFPETAKRTAKGHKPIDQQNLIMKRWSVGKIIDYQAVKDYGDLMTHSADILPGSSGSGLFNDSGVVVGINTTLLNPNPDFDFQGGGCGKANTERAAIPPSAFNPLLNIFSNVVPQ